MLAAVGIAVCVGAVVVAWVAGALYNAHHSLHNASHAPRERIRSQPGSTALIVVAVVCAGLAVVSRSHFDGLAVGALWIRVLGLAVLAASTVFTLWARFSLGTMWNGVPQVKDDHQLRTHGPYAVTRHPIYTGLLGMLLGATLLSGIGQWIVLFPVGLIVFEVKIRIEEHLMLATFPEEYPRYRRQVPQLVPGLHGRAARRGLRQSQGETAQSRQATAAASKDRDDLIGQRDTARTYTATTLGNGTTGSYAAPQPGPADSQSGPGVPDGPPTPAASAANGSRP
jgi:protein-S-isoprenylcysteine O-methyltransferase Ste14